MSVGVLQESVHEPVLYLRYTASVPTLENTVLDLFADDIFFFLNGRRSSIVVLDFLAVKVRYIHTN